MGRLQGMTEITNLPVFSDIVDLLLPVTIEWESEDWTIERWRDEYIGQVRRTRQEQDKLKVFNRFSASLVQGFRTKHKDFEPRIDRMNHRFKSFDDISSESVYALLSEEGYSFLTRGVQVIIEAKSLVEPPSFIWEDYFRRAELACDGDRQDDMFLGISGVGLKVRDFALKQFSTCWCAMDRHVTRVLQRTGLILHGQGEPGYGDDPTNNKNYAFMQSLLVRFSKESGWCPGATNGYSPGEIDSMFWFFGHGVCTAKPLCQRCPVAGICITFQEYGGSVDFPAR